jgi:hypothetical protein
MKYLGRFLEKNPAERGSQGPETFSDLLLQAPTKPTKPPLLVTVALPWQVDGTNGENAILASAATQSEAWHRACQQAEAVGMLKKWKSWTSAADPNSL